MLSSLFLAAALYPGILQSHWLWNRVQAVTNGAVSVYRDRIVLTEKPVRASFSVRFDDAGDMFLNGRRLNPSDAAFSTAFVDAAHGGENLLALCCRNGSSAAGLIYLGRIEYADGRTQYVHSTTAVRAMDGFSPLLGKDNAWTLPGFDDAAWPAAEDLGAADAWPWAKNDRGWKRFCSPDECAKMARREAQLLALPPTLAKEPPISARVVYEGLRPYVVVNGERLEPDLSLTKIDNDAEARQAAGLAKLGLRFFRIETTETAFAAGGGDAFDFSDLELQVARTLEIRPNAYFELSVGFGRDTPWLAAHPEAMVGYATGEAKPGANDLKDRPRRPSVASPVYRARVRQELEALSAYVTSRPWGNRVALVRIMYGIYREWHQYGMYDAPDTGVAMTARFREYLKDPNATVPTFKERNRSDAVKLDPVHDRRLLDYYDCTSKMMADALIEFCGIAKRALPGRLAGAYYGYVFSGHPAEGANVLLDRVLSAPEVDFLSNPPNYTGYNRQAGGPFALRTVPTLFRKYGKLCLCEDDSRHYHTPGLDDAHRSRTPEESAATAKRNYLLRHFDGVGVQYLTTESRWLGRKSNFEDPIVLQAIADAKRVSAKVGPQPAESGNDTVFIVDYRERLKIPFNRPRAYEIYYDTLIHYYRSGASFDVMDLQDFLSGEATSPYRHFIFLNVFELTAEERRRLRWKTQKANATAIWHVAPAPCDGEKFSDAFMQETSGVRLTGAGPAMKVACSDAAAEEFLPGVWKKSLPNNGKAIVALRCPKSAAEARAILAEAEIFLHSEADSFFRKHAGLCLFHTGRAGRHRIVFPEAVSGRELFSGVSFSGTEMTIDTEGPDTRLLKLDSPHGGPIAYINTVAGAPQAVVNGTILPVFAGGVHRWWRSSANGTPRHSDAPLSVVTVYLRTDWHCYGYRPENIDRSLAAYAKAHSNAWYVVDLNCRPNAEWAAAHPDEIAVDEEGGFSRDGNTAWSYGSELALDYVKDLQTKAILHLENSPYADRIIGYRPSGGHTIEWLGWDARKGRQLDYSPAMQRRFERFCRERHPEFADRTIPTLAERRTGGARVDAYYTCYNESCVDCLIELCRNARKLTSGRKLIGSFYGYTATLGNTGNPMRAHYAARRLLDAKCVDFLLSPQTYFLRGPAGTMIDMKPFATYQKNGILSIVEDDTRTHCASSHGRLFQTKTAAESQDIIRRNASIALCRREPCLFLALEDGSEFRYPEFAADGAILREEMARQIERKTERHAEIALVTSERNFIGRPVNNIGERAYRESYLAFARAGAPVDYVLWEDFRDRPCSYRLVVFLDAYPDSKEFAAMTAFSKTCGATCLFGNDWEPDAARINALLKASGVFVFSDSLDPVEANDGYFTLHAATAGKKTIRLPRKGDVYDVFAKRFVAKGVESFTFDAPLHSSWLFRY